MIEAYLGQIIMGGWDFAPYGTLMCHGQILNVYDNSALYALLGTRFGGDGQNTFGLPDMRGRVPMGWGQGAGLSNHYLAEKGGTETVTLTVAQLPAHTHAVDLSGTSVNITNHLQVSGDVTVSVSDNVADSVKPEGNGLAKRTTDSSGDTVNIYDEAPAFSGRALSGVSHSLEITGDLHGKLAGSAQTSAVGGNQPHSNMQPYLCVSFAIVTMGIFPSRD